MKVGCPRLTQATTPKDWDKKFTNCIRTVSLDLDSRMS